MHSDFYKFLCLEFTLPILLYGQAESKIKNITNLSNKASNLSIATPFAGIPNFVHKTRNFRHP